MLVEASAAENITAQSEEAKRRFEARFFGAVEVQVYPGIYTHEYSRQLRNSYIFGEDVHEGCMRYL